MTLSKDKNKLYDMESEFSDVIRVVNKHAYVSTTSTGVKDDGYKIQTNFDNFADLADMAIPTCPI